MLDLPEHFTIEVDASGRGPVDLGGAQHVATVCWCGRLDCAEPFPAASRCPACTSATGAHLPADPACGWTPVAHTPAPLPQPADAPF